MNNSREIYKAKLHEIVDGDDLDDIASVLRVPGGWIYTVYVGEGATSVFVPYSNEFNIGVNNGS